MFDCGDDVFEVIWNTLLLRHSLILVSSDHNILFQSKADFLRWRLANSRQAFMCLGFSRGVFLGVQECSPTWWSVWLIVSLQTLSQLPAVPSEVPLVRHFPNNGSSCLFTHFMKTPFSREVSSQAMFLIMALIVLMGILSMLEIFQYPIPWLRWSIITIQSCWERAPLHVTAKSSTSIQSTWRHHGAWHALTGQWRFSN